MTCYSLLPCKAAGLALIAAGFLAAPPTAIKGWGQADDPDGDCRFEARDSKLTIRVPGTLHNLVADSGHLNAPTVLSPNTVRPEFCCSEFVIAIIEHVCCRHGQQMGALRGRPIG